jgi:hypothetical protein
VEADKESRREDVRKEKKEAMAVKKMEVVSSQPSIKSKLRSGLPGVCVSEIAFRIGDSIEEVGCTIPKTYGTFLPQECSETSLPDERVAGGAVTEITWRIEASTGEVLGKIPKTYGAFLPQECLDTPLSAMNVCTEKPEETSRASAMHVVARVPRVVVELDIAWGR